MVGGSWRWGCLGLGLLLVAGCAAAPTHTAGFPALPPSCGRRPAPVAAVSTVPASTAPSGTPLPLYGGAVNALAANGSLLFASSYNAPGGNRLFTSRDDGQHWSPVVPTPSGVIFSALALSPGGHTLAALGNGRLDLATVSTLAQMKGAAWRTSTPLDLQAMAWDPSTHGRLAVVGGTVGAAGSATLYLSDDDGATWRSWSLPGHLGAGAALAFWHGEPVVALGQTPGPAAVVSLGASGLTDLPVPPSSAASVSALSAVPGGDLLLVAGARVWRLAPGSASWSAVSLPPVGRGQQPSGFSAAPGQYALLTLPASSVGGPGQLWVANAASGPWRRVDLLGVWAGAPVADGTDLWLPSSVGPLRVPARAAAAQVASTGLPAPVTVVASAAWHPTLVAAGWSGGLFVSRDGGKTFAVRTPPGIQTESIASLSFTTDGGCLVLIYASQGLLGLPTAYLSGNRGRTWEELPVPGNAADVLSLAEWPPESGVWWLVEGGSEGGLFRSLPGRAGWTRVSLPRGAVAPARVVAGQTTLWVEPGYQGAGAWRLQSAPRGLVALWDHLRHRPPRGTWVEDWGAAADVTPSPYRPGVVYAGLRRSLDGGTTWTRTSPLPSVAVSSGARWQAAAAPDGPGLAVAGLRHLWRDRGNGWGQLWSTSNTEQTITGVAVAGPGRFYLAVQGLGLITVRDPNPGWNPPAAVSPGGRWTPPSGGAPVVGLEARAPSDPSVVYRVGPAGELSVSHDAGRAFYQLSALQLSDGTRCCTAAEVAGPHVVVDALAVSPASADTLYVGLGLAGPAGFTPEMGLWVSHDGGQTWSRADLPGNPAVPAVAVAPGGQIVWALAAKGDTAARELWVSRDGGATWSQANGLSGPLYSVAAPSAQEVLVGGAGALWRSRDGGGAFTQVPVAVPGWEEPSGDAGLPVDAVLRTSTGLLYVGGGAGVALSMDGGAHWQDISTPVGDPAVEPGGLGAGPGGTVLVRTAAGLFTYTRLR